ncbi:MAG TPA: hypothetical protein VJM31_16830 [Vicinamibacterales bacterium]|nr:hypothetical protein [Vicinamibacterales bacterium]
MRDFSFGESHDSHAKECQSLEEAGGVLLISAEAVQRFGEDDVEFALERATHQRLKAGSKQRSPGNGVIMELVGDLPAFAFGERATDANLISDGGIALVVGGVTSVKSNLHCRPSSAVFSVLRFAHDCSKSSCAA